MQEIDLQNIIFDIAGSRVTHAARVQKGGYTAAQRWLITMQDGRKLFVKNATDSFTAKRLRAEYKICSEIKATFMPKVAGWFEGVYPVLVREDIEGAWPPPWNEKQIASFAELLESMAGYQTKALLPDVDDIQHLGHWKLLTASPGAYKALRDLPAGWLKKNSPALLELESSADLAGESLIHFDLRGENICFTDHGIKIIDWDHAARGNPAIDQAMWRINLHIEGGPPPWQKEFTNIPVVAVLCSFFAYSSSLSAPVGISPEILNLQKRQFDVSLDWLIRLAGLQPITE